MIETRYAIKDTESGRYVVQTVYYTNYTDKIECAHLWKNEDNAINALRRKRRKKYLHVVPIRVEITDMLSDEEAIARSHKKCLFEECVPSGKRNAVRRAKILANEYEYVIFSGYNYTAQSMEKYGSTKILVLDNLIYTNNKQEVLTYLLMLGKGKREKLRCINLKKLANDELVSKKDYYDY